jgi:hypothetical protein
MTEVLAIRIDCPTVYANPVLTVIVAEFPANWRVYDVVLVVEYLSPAIPDGPVGPVGP